MTDILSPIAPWRFDGILLNDGAGNALHLNPLNVPEDSPYALSWTLANTRRAVYKSGTAHGMHAPAGTTRKSWSVDIASCNDVLRKLIERKVRRNITHTLASKLIEGVPLSGGANPVEPTGMTEAYLDRYVLSAAHTTAAGRGTNPTDSTASMLEVWNMVTDTMYTLIYRRSVEVVNNGGIGAGAVITIAATDRGGASLYADTLVEGVDWFIGGGAAATATSIAAAMDALAYLAAAGDAAHAVYRKDDSDIIALSVTTDQPLNVLLPHPSSTEVALDVSTIFTKFRNLKFGATPPAEPSSVILLGHWLYRCSAYITNTSLVNQVATDHVGMSLVIEDIGVAGIDPENAP